MLRILHTLSFGYSIQNGNICLIFPFDIIDDCREPFPMLDVCACELKLIFLINYNHFPVELSVCVWKNVSKYWIKIKMPFVVISFMYFFHGSIQAIECLVSGQSYRRIVHRLFVDFNKVSFIWTRECKKKQEFYSIPLNSFRFVPFESYNNIVTLCKYFGRVKAP